MTDYGTRVPAMVARETCSAAASFTRKRAVVGLQMLRNFAKNDGGGKMKVIPAIDLKDGQCVRLQKGDWTARHIR